MIRILLADDLTIIRKGVRQILTQAYPTAQIEEVEEGEIWVDRLEGRSWDMVISARSRSGCIGNDLLRRVREDFPSLPVLILGLYTREYQTFRPLQPAEPRFPGKDAAHEELLWAVSQVLAGKKFIALPGNN